MLAAAPSPRPPATAATNPATAVAVMLPEPDQLFPSSCWLIPSLVALTVKNLLAVQEAQVQSLGQEDPLEKGMATHSSILAWRIPWTEEPGVLQSTGNRLST